MPVLAPVVLSYYDTPWQSDPFFDNVHMCGHMLGIVDVPLYAMLPHNLNKFLVQLLPLFFLAGLSAEQPLPLVPAESYLNSASVPPPGFYI